MKGRLEHRIPYELSGLATLMVDYLSRWGEEVEILSVVLATLIIGLILDAQGLLNNLYLGLAFSVIVAVEFIFAVYAALRRREIEFELWRAVYELEKSSSADSTDSNGK